MVERLLNVENGTFEVHLLGPDMPPRNIDMNRSTTLPHQRGNSDYDPPSRGMFAAVLIELRLPPGRFESWSSRQAGSAGRGFMLTK